MKISLEFSKLFRLEGKQCLYFQLTDMKIFQIYFLEKQKRIFYFQLTNTKK
eukprot:UN01157